MNSIAMELTELERLSDLLKIKRAVESWVIYRDRGDWEGLRALWHKDGIMVATWFDGPAHEFIEASKQGWERGSIVHHFLGAFEARIVDNRAIAQTKVILSARAPVHGVLSDITCTGRFYDRFEKVGSEWLLLRRQVIYEKDRLDPVQHGERVDIKPELLDRFPQGYRHLAYMQSNSGQPVLSDLPGLRGAAVEKLYRESDEWLQEG
ncbi:nuclear transport factor 2 family protein [Fertoebacter nigrum]|uniref:Nuclear transport factor 2 family protein n=1 Tax=Fertoeibacter niger TaxID=2656921 RepID=A0A8X8H4Y3_9RHOB|nr:nuclear transport factor 2 family protein [Fertoeibacter niger]NUB46469.1 nuclear transport factor 2 family protein [Fertoeibacter niger]